MRGTCNPDTFIGEVETILAVGMGIPAPVRCVNCGELVHAAPQDVGRARVEYLLPVDARGWCSLCVWLEDS